MNIVLIGMPGSGKSTLGVLLAKAMGYDFIDTDVVIQNVNKKLLQEIITIEGYEGFLTKEEDAILSLDATRTVISTGGSVIYSHKAMEYLKKNSIVIYLYIDINEVERRIKNISTRGIVFRKGQDLKDIFEERNPIYSRYANIIVDLNNLKIENSISKIIDLLKKENY